ncbi:endoribonuclease Dicer [Papilio machaon]|uniref:endoribonuclease Dicer n=1 Tax=Papilio machaon TaxID=76193 RepID=UPI001E6644EE|nr:endoribonuclease Dicer [Papilio machaon]
MTAILTIPPHTYEFSVIFTIAASSVTKIYLGKENHVTRELKFRMHECNLLLATPTLEEGIDLPRCNLVLRWDVPPSYRSHALCRGRARAPRSSLALLAEAPQHSEMLLHHLAIYKELDEIVTRKCGCGIQDEPTSEEESYADDLTAIVKAYTPMENKMTQMNTETVITLKNKNDEGNKEKRQSIEDKKENLEESRNERSNNTDSDKDIAKNEIELDRNETESDRNNEINMKEVSTKEVKQNFGNKISVNSNNDKSDSDYKNIVVDSEVNERTIKKSDSDSIASVDLSTAIALINRYCGKLPSDTFTRLAPQWWMEEVSLPDSEGNMKKAYICTLRLPLNCPVKYNIVGHPMPTRVLARRMVALQACRILHKSGELDNQLMPIGKENFKAVELEGTGNGNGNGIEPIDPNDSARPGTTKRRQYYYKRTACAFTDCQPVVDATDEEIESGEYDASKRHFKPGEKRNTLYAIDSRLWCALPERYNTRGRRLHAPQHARQAIGILMARHRADKLQIPAFPVYTRSGEVRVSVELAEDADVRLSPRRARLVRRFMRFVFSDVLRVRRRGMKLQSEGSTHNNYYIVPTIKTLNEDGTSKVGIDWSFLELIFKHTEEKRNLEVEKPIFFQQEEDEVIEEKKVENNGKGKDEQIKKMDNPLLKEGETFTFDPEKYKEAVVTPWYIKQLPSS